MTPELSVSTHHNRVEVSTRLLTFVDKNIVHFKKKSLKLKVSIWQTDVEPVYRENNKDIVSGYEAIVEHLFAKLSKASTPEYKAPYDGTGEWNPLDHDDGHQDPNGNYNTSRDGPDLLGDDEGPMSKSDITSRMRGAMAKRGGDGSAIDSMHEDEPKNNNDNTSNINDGGNGDNGGIRQRPGPKEPPRGQASAMSEGDMGDMLDARLMDGFDDYQFMD